jgi:hypothetical protein
MVQVQSEPQGFSGCGKQMQMYQTLVEKAVGKPASAADYRDAPGLMRACLGLIRRQWRSRVMPGHRGAVVIAAMSGRYRAQPQERRGLAEQISEEIREA